MIELALNAGLAHEPLERSIVDDAQSFDRDVAPDLDVARGEHVAHSTAPDLLAELVPVTGEHSPRRIEIALHGPIIVDTRHVRHIWCVAAIVLTSVPAHATYSIVAVDGSTNEVGGAGTSCVGSLSVRVIYGSVPGTGAVHAQAQLGGPGKAEAVMQLQQNIAPESIIAAITNPGFDGNAQRRQYGIVDLQMRSAGFTGSQNGAFAGDRQADVAAFTYSIQGNILTSMAVLDQAAGAFDGCDLADRLMRSLEAGALNGEGDSRCTGRGVPADSAFIEVDREGEPEGTYLRLEVIDTGNQNPLVLLRAQYDTWRATHPCPVLPPDAGAGGDAGTDPGVEMGGGCCSGSRGHTTAIFGVLIVVVLRRAKRSS